MTAPNYTDDELVEAWNKLGSATLVAKHLNTHKAGVLGRRRAVEKRRGIELKAWNSQRPEAIRSKYPGVIEAKLFNGTCVVFNDAHFWPDMKSTAHRALIKVIKQFHPEIIINNGDSLDGARISRWPRIGWDDTPTMMQELQANKEYLGEIEDLSKGILIWNLGNHCSRFENFLAAHAPQYEGVPGFSLKDHFPRWMPSWSTVINDEVLVIHRFKGGMHAPHNNALWAGLSTITGHLHSQKVMPITDMRGTRWGCDTGCLADPRAKQFSDYTETRPKDWRSGFCILTFKDGKMLPPELVTVWDEDSVTFRGAIIPV